MTIKEIYDLCQPISIYKTGSSCFLKNPHDKDLVLYYETKEEAIEHLTNMPHNTGYCLHFDYVGHIIHDTGSYIYAYMKKSMGKTISFEGFNFLNEKEEYAYHYRKFYRKLPDTAKTWYRILTASYIFSNNSYELTEEQKEHIQKVHDDGIIDEESKRFILNILK